MEKNRVEEIKKALEEAGIADTELEEVRGGLSKGCDSCSPGCVSSCQPGNVNPNTAAALG